ncbi:MAG: hypothetical protein K6E10_02810 [Eubacterium sp.]|nr:hypothetical protein [Eubacterium sp.]
MFRILYSDTRKMIYDRSFHTCLLINIFYQFFSVLVLKLTNILYPRIILYADDVAFNFGSFSIFLIFASTLITTASDYSDGCIRNKIISGASRTSIYLSGATCGLLHGVIHSMAACITSILCNLIFSLKWNTYTVQEISDYWLIITLSCMALGVFSTTLIIVLGGHKSSYVIGLSIVIAMKILSLDVLDKLYPEEGKCTLTGLKLDLYQFIEKYVPFLYTIVRPHFGFSTYMLGAGGLIIISLILGLVIFNRKEIR